MAFPEIRRLRDRPTVFAAALLIAGSICVSLWMACVLVTAPIEQVARRRRAGLILFSLFLLIQPVAASIVRRQLFAKSTGLRKMFQIIWLTVACAIASIGLGVFINLLEYQLLSQVARSLFGF
jgi:NADH:ubiquinone oxidoreductase subunit K